MLRLRLRPADLNRVYFADRPHPVGITLLASQVLRGSGAAATAPALADRAAGATRAGPARAAAAALRHLLPARGRLPDFLTPFDGLESVAAGLDVIRATPLRRVRAEVAAAYAELPATPLRRRFAAADPEVFDLFVRAARTYHEGVLTPHWAALALVHRHHVAAAAQRYALSGLDGLLRGLHPAIRWRAPVLEIDTWWSGDLSGTGCGLLLVPTPLAGARPRVLVERGRPVLLAYPAPMVLPAAAAPGGDPLAGLLGRTRAAVLRQLADPGPHTTSTLARGAHISLASASEHAATLRAAGLVGSHRDGGSMRHGLTPLGLHLLSQCDPQQPTGPLP